MRGALRHPVGLTLLTASTFLAGVMRFVPALAPWSAEASWVFGLGLLSYGGAALSVYWTRARPDEDPVPLPSHRTGPIEPNGPSSRELKRLFEHALRQLNRPAALSSCELVNRLPRTLAVTRLRWGRERSSGSLPLAPAQALREVLISAIEGLKPANEPVQNGAPGQLQYHILHERYVQQKPVAYTLTRHNIAERTFHRYRNAAISAMARDLHGHEEQIARGEEPNAARPPQDPGRAR